MLTSDLHTHMHLSMWTCMHVHTHKETKLWKFGEHFLRRVEITTTRDQYGEGKPVVRLSEGETWEGGVGGTLRV